MRHFQPVHGAQSDTFVDFFIKKCKLGVEKSVRRVVVICRVIVEVRIQFPEVVY